MLWKYTAAWFGMMLLAIMNGAVREAFFTPALGNAPAQQLSTATLLLLLSLYIWFLVRRWPLETGRRALLVGFIWLVMTVAFESGVGCFLGGRTWGEILQDYNLLAGRLWVLIPAWIFAAPSLFYRLTR
jgi:hypothetical protein